MGHGVVAVVGEGVFDADQGHLAEIQATQIRTLDLVTFNAAATAYETGDARLFRLAVRRLRPGYRPAFEAWMATHPIKNPDAPADPSLMPEYHIPQSAQARVFNAAADAHFSQGQASASIADRYVRLTVFLAAVLFLVGIGSRFPVRSARYTLTAVAAALLVASVAQLLDLPGPPS
jgi:hypothetical protein